MLSKRPNITGASQCFDDSTTALDGELAADWLSRSPLPMLVVGADMLVLWHNEAAGAVLSSALPIGLVDGRICFTDNLGNDAWRQTFADTKEKPVRRVVFSRRGEPELVLGVVGKTLNDANVVCVSLIAFSASLDISECGLSDEFGLTQSEARIAQMLVNLDTPREIGDRLDVSINTVRTHVRNIFAKMGVSSQREMLRLASSFCMA